MTRDLWLLYRERIVAVALLALLNAGLLVAAVLPARDAARLREAGATREAAEARARAEAASTRATLAETRRQADALLAAFPTRTRLLEVTTRLQGAARRLGLAVPVIEYHPEARPAAGQPLDRTGVAMRLEGPYGAVRRLLHEVEREGRALVIESVALRGRAGGRVQMALDLSAYARLTVPTVAPPASAALPAEVPLLLAHLVDRPLAPYRPESRDLFGARRPVAPAAVRAAPVPPRPAAPTPPPAAPAATPVARPPAGDLRLLGTLGGERGQRAFVSVAGEVVVVRRGDRIGPGGYVVKEIAPERLVLGSPDGERETTLSLGEGARHAP